MPQACRGMEAYGCASFGRSVAAVCDDASVILLMCTLGPLWVFGRHRSIDSWLVAFGGLKVTPGCAMPVTQSHTTYILSAASSFLVSPPPPSTCHTNPA